MSISKKRRLTFLLVAVALLVGGTAIWYLGRQFMEFAALQRIDRALDDLRGHEVNGLVLDWADRTSARGVVQLRGVTLRQNGADLLIADDIRLERSALSLELQARNVTLIRDGLVTRFAALQATGLRHRFLRAATAADASAETIAASLDGAHLQIENLELAAPEYMPWSHATARQASFTIEESRLRDVRISDLTTDMIRQNAALQIDAVALNGLKLGTLLSLPEQPQDTAAAAALLDGASLGAEKIQLTTENAIITLDSLAGDVSGPHLRNVQIQSVKIALPAPERIGNFALRRMAQSGQPAQVSLFALDRINLVQLSSYAQQPEADFSAATVINSGFDVGKVQVLNAAFPQILTLSSFIYTRTPDRTEDVQVRNLDLDMTTLAADNAALSAALPSLLFHDLSLHTRRDAFSTTHRLQTRVQRLGLLNAVVHLNNLDLSVSGISRPDPSSMGRIEYSMRLEDRGLVAMIERLNRQHRIDFGHRLRLRLSGLLQRDDTTDLINLPERVQNFILSPDTPLEFSLSVRMQDSNGALSVYRIRVGEPPPDIFE